MNAIETESIQKESKYTQDDFTKGELVETAIRWMAQGEILHSETEMTSTLEALAVITIDKEVETSIKELAILGQYCVTNDGRSNHFINLRYISPEEMGNFVIHPDDDFVLNHIRGERHKNDDDILSDIWVNYGPFAYASINSMDSEDRLHIGEINHLFKALQHGRYDEEKTKVCLLQLQEYRNTS